MSEVAVTSIDPQEPYAAVCLLGTQAQQRVYFRQQSCKPLRNACVCELCEVWLLMLRSSVLAAIKMP